MKCMHSACKTLSIHNTQQDVIMLIKYTCANGQVCVSELNKIKSGPIYVHHE